MGKNLESQPLTLAELGERANFTQAQLAVTMYGRERFYR
jgi:hypothetical protein